IEAGTKQDRRGPAAGADDSRLCDLRRRIHAGNLAGLEFQKAIGVSEISGTFGCGTKVGPACWSSLLNYLPPSASLPATCTQFQAGPPGHPKCEVIREILG